MNPTKTGGELRNGKQFLLHLQRNAKKNNFSLQILIIIRIIDILTPSIIDYSRLL